MAGEFGISMLTERLMPGVSQSSHMGAKAAESLATADAKAGPSFHDTLKSALGDVNQALTHADEASRQFAAGESTNLHDVMIAMEKADVSLRTLNAVRAKVVDAYQEIMRMQV